MGIPKFFGQLITKRKLKYEDAPSGTFPEEISGLMIDLNDLLHFFAAKVYLYGDFKSADPKKNKRVQKMSDEQLEKEFIDNIVARLEYYLENYEPSEYFIVAVDGPAPLAKIAQQRIRRIGGGPNKTTDRFDSASLSPGTQLMEKIHLRLKDWFRETFGSPRDGLPQFASYSSHHEPGEGEHKMISILLRNKSKMDLKKRGLHVMCGQDSDLIMLGTLLPLQDVVHYREDRKEEVKTGQITPENYMVDLFKNYIYSLFRRKGMDSDFILMYFMFGNDFVPKNPALDNASYTADDLARAYITNGKKLIDNKTGAIYRDRFIDFLSLFEETEIVNLDTIAAAYNPKIQPPYPILTKNIVKKNGKIIVDVDGFKHDWYMRAMETYNNLSEGAPYDDLDVFVRDMCEDYLRILQWNLDYYQRRRDVAWNFQYSYFFAPFLSDVGKLPREGEIQRMRDSWEKESSILRQLIMISHPAKIRSFIPNRFHNLLENPLIVAKTPEEAVVFVDGKGKYYAQGRMVSTEHLRITVLPLVSQDSYSEVIDGNSESLPSRMKVHFRYPDYYIQDPIEKVSERVSSKILKWRS